MVASSEHPRFTPVEELIQESLIPRGITNSSILNAFRIVPREFFLPVELRPRAYENSALPISHGQTISQPLMIAIMLSELECTRECRVLEIGGGSGYQAALLSMLVKEVLSIERIEPMARQAESLLRSMGIENVRFIAADGSVGYPDESPYDRIIVSCAAPQIPAPLTNQLAMGGRLVVPVGGRSEQTLLVVTRTESGLVTEERGPCVFVPLIGAEGWSEDIN